MDTALVLHQTNINGLANALADAVKVFHLYCIIRQKRFGGTLIKTHLSYYLQL
jgi:hypothetical protein